MKRVIKVSIFVFLFFIVSSVYADSFTWDCTYSYNGITFKYQVTNLDSEYIKSSQLLQSDSSKLKNYVSFWYKYNGQYVQLANGKAAKDYDGSTKGVKLYNNVTAYGFLNNSIKNNTVKCPTLYREMADGTGGTPIDHRIITSSKSCNDNVTGCIGDQFMVSNTSISSIDMNCKNNTTGKTGKNCDSLVSQETLHSDTTKRECEYTSNSNTSNGVKFRITYDSSSDSLSYNSLGGSASHKIFEVNKLKQDFKDAFARNACPTYLSCDYHVTNVLTGAAIIYIGPSSMTEYTDNSGKTKKFSGRCGSITDDNGEKVNNTSQHESELVLNGSTLDISDEKLTCEELLKENLRKVLHLFITAVRIAGAIIAIVMMMLSLIPAITSDDAGELKKATKKCIYIGIVLVAIGLLPTIVGVIGRIAGFDLTCL